MIFLYGYKVTKRDYEHDKEIDYYSKYLGPNWREQKYTGTRVPTIVCNHGGFIEDLAYIIILSSPPQFTPMKQFLEFKGAYILKCMQAFPLDRAGTQAERDAQVKVISERQKMTMHTEQDYGPVMVYSEGGTSNMKCLQRYRRGAFSSGLPVQPTHFRWDYKTLSPDYATLPGFEVTVMHLCEFAMQDLTVHCYPLFIPNDYMYTEYAKTIEGHEKMEKWEIYAHAIEDFTRRQGGFGVGTPPLKDMINLKGFVQGRKKYIV